MSKGLALILSIVILVALFAIFVITVIINKKTPAPKGCEINIENCSMCSNSDCSLKKKEDE